MKHLASAPLPAIAATGDEETWERRIGDMLTRLDDADQRKQPRIILRGGTAARLGHGLSRPSADIDADATEALDIWALLTQAAQRAGLIAMATPARRSTTKGRLTLSDPRIATPKSIDIDVRIVRDPEVLASIGKLTERRNGIWMYTARELARQKIEMATEPGRRRRAKDRYDIAWWLHNGIEHIAPELRTELDRALRADALIAVQWDTQHRRSEMLNRIESTVVHDALMTALDRDPAVLKERWPDGRLTMSVHAKNPTEVTWQREPPKPSQLAIGSFTNDDELASFMLRMGLRSERDTPKLLEEIKLRREQANGTSDTRKEAHEAVDHPNSAWNMDEKKGNVANNAWVGDPAKATTGFEPPQGTRGGGKKLTQTERERVRAIERGKALILPQTLNEAFERLSERLKYISAPGTFVLGGGTVLGARYKHRESTDLDVFCSLSTSEQIDREHGERVWITHLEEWLGENPDRTVGAMTVVGKIGDVPFSVCPANGVLETGTPQEIYGHSIAGQTTHEILEGKILGRIIDENTPNTIRDLYDITVAARLEPQAMRSVLTKLARWPRQVERAAESLNDTPSDLHKTDPKPIIKARYDLELADLAKRLIPMIRSAEPGQAPTTRPAAIKNKKNPKGGWER